METANYHISLDVQHSHSGLTLEMKHNDTHRRLYITLTDGGRPYKIGADCYGVFTAKKPDGTAIFNDCAISGNTLIYDVTAQTTAAVGELACQVRLYGSDGALLTAAAFTVLITPAVVSDSDDIASVPEATALARLLDRVEKVEDFMDESRLGDKAWSAKKLMDTLCPGFSATGSLVTCYPVAGYPLTVTGSGTHLGKNLLGFADYSGITATNRTMECTDGVHKSIFTGAVSTTWIITNDVADNLTGKRLPPGTYVFSIRQQSTGKSYTNCYAVLTLDDGTTVELPHGEAVTLEQYATVSQFRCKSSGGGFTPGTVIRFTLQIEPGEVATAYTPYRAEQVSDGTVTAWEGMNTFIGEEPITVTGRKDIITILEGI